MRQKRHRDYLRKDFLEDFKSLPKSDFWPYLPRKTRSDILSMLDEFLVDKEGNIGDTHFQGS